MHVTVVKATQVEAPRKIRLRWKLQRRNSRADA